MKRQISIILAFLMIFTAIPFNSIAVFADENKELISAEGVSDDSVASEDNESDYKDSESDIEISDNDLENDSENRNSISDDDISDESNSNSDDSGSEDSCSDNVVSDNSISDNSVSMDAYDEESVSNDGVSENDIEYPVGGVLEHTLIMEKFPKEDVLYDCEEIYDELNEDGVVTDKEIGEYFEDALSEELSDEIPSLGSQAYENDWDKYGSNYVYNQLPAKKKVVWLALNAACAKVLESDSTYSSTPSVGSDIFETAQEFANFIDVFKYSNPQYFFLSNKMTGNQFGPTDFALRIVLYDNMKDGESRSVCKEQFVSKLNTFISKVDNNADENIRIKSIHDVICEDISYNHEVLADNKITDEEEQELYTQSAYSAIVMHNTVCAGYTKATVMLCNYFDIDCMGISSPGHAWNKVRVYDSWYCTDNTWDSQNTGVYYWFYLKSEDIFHSQEYAGEKYVYHILDSHFEGLTPLCTLDSGSSLYTAGDAISPSNKVATPTITATPDAEGYSVTMSTETSGAKIYYTINGDAPSDAYTRSTLYTGTFNISNFTVIKAVAVKDTMEDSDYRVCRASNTYAVNYYLNGGTNNEDNPSKYVYAESGSIVLKNPTKDEEDFAGWYTTSTFDAGTKVTAIDLTLKKDLNLYAKWGTYSYNIEFNANGGTGAMSTLTKDGRESFTMPACTFTAPSSSKEFKEWNTKADGSGTTYKAGNVYSKLTTTPDGTVTLYAIWQTKKYTITFDNNGGTGGTESLKLSTGETYSNLVNPTRSGYKFLGWYDNKTGGNQVKSGDTFTGTSNTTIYARWLNIDRSVVDNTLSKITGITIIEESENNRNTISWTASSNPSVVGYVVLASTSSRAIEDFELLGFTTSTSFYDTVAKHFKYYIITPCSYSADESYIRQGGSYESKDAEVIPTAPSNITTTQYGNTKMHITWTGDARATGYKIYFNDNKIGDTSGECSFDDMNLSGRCNLSGQNGKYSVSATYSNADGKGYSYSGDTAATSTETLTLMARDIATLKKIVVDPCVSTGSPLTPAVTVYSYYGIARYQMVVDPSYYTVNYSNNILPGTGTVTITAKAIGPFYGETSGEFEILDAPTEITYDTAKSEFRISDEKQMKAFVQIANGLGTNGISYVIKDTTGADYAGAYNTNMKLMNSLDLADGVLSFNKSGANIVFDLNNKTLSTSKSTSSLAGIIDISNANITIKNGKVNCNVSKTAIYAIEGSNVTIDNTEVSSLYNEGIDSDGNSAEVSIVNGSKIISKDIAVRLYNGASATVNGSNVTSKNLYAIHSNKAGSSITVRNSNIYGRYDDYQVGASSPYPAIWSSGSLVISDGSYIEGYNYGVKVTGNLTVDDATIKAKAYKIEDGLKVSTAIYYDGTAEKSVSLKNCSLKAVVDTYGQGILSYGIYSKPQYNSDIAKGVLSCLAAGQGYNNLPEGTVLDASSKMVPGSDVQVGTARISFKYVLNGGVNNAGNPSWKLVTDTTFALGNPTKAGYDFAGWYDNSSFTGSAVTTVNPATIQGTSKTYYAKWTPKTYTIHFKDYDDNTLSADRIITYGESMWGSDEMPVPIRSGYTFIGWYTKKVADDTDPSDSVALAGATLVNENATVETDYPADVTVYALYKTGGLLLHFDANGGAAVDDVEVNYGMPYGENGWCEPERNRYIFDGWYTSKTGGKEITETDIFKGFADETLYAHWTAIGFTEPVYYVVIGKKINVSLNVPDGADSYLTANKKTATVTASGVVKGVKKGKVKITAEYDDEKYVCTVQVVKKPTIKGVKKLKIKKTAKFKVKDGGGPIIWSSSKPAVATVDQNGKVTALAKGSTNIIAERNGIKMKIKLKVTK